MQRKPQKDCKSGPFALSTPTPIQHVPPRCAAAPSRGAALAGSHRGARGLAISRGGITTS